MLAAFGRKVLLRVGLQVCRLRVRRQDVVLIQNGKRPHHLMELSVVLKIHTESRVVAI